MTESKAEFEVDQVINRNIVIDKVNKGVPTAVYVFGRRYILDPNPPKRKTPK